MATHIRVPLLVVRTAVIPELHDQDITENKIYRVLEEHVDLTGEKTSPKESSPHTVQGRMVICVYTSLCDISNVLGVKLIQSRRR